MLILIAVIYTSIYNNEGHIKNHSISFTAQEIYVENGFEG